MKLGIIAAGAFAAVVCVSGAAFAEGDAAAGAKVAAKCVSCHKGIVDGKGGPLGPNLSGVLGRTIGTEADYAKKYDEGYIALGEQGEVWSPENLAAYLPDPKAFLKEKGVSPKSKMTFKLKKEGDIADLIAYLQSR